MSRSDDRPDERSDDRPDERSDDRPDERFWSARNVGVLLLVAALAAVCLYGSSGKWPAGFDGLVVGVFAAAGITLVGYSLRSTVASRDSARQ
ncbi:hypothetical protein [Halosimplex marinum]|uniref:hypothetical protein n=1 Tax=Halosimplex marinum TaxID=3396620 RepID=UPI003F565E09